MTRKTRDESEEEETDDAASNEPIEVGRFPTAKGAIVVSVGSYQPEEGEAFAPTIRVARQNVSTGKRAVDGFRFRPLGSLKSPEEALGLAELLKKAAPVLKKAQKS